MKRFLTFFVFTICTVGFSQNITKTELIGKWTTTDLVVKPPKTRSKDKDITNELKKGFINSTFDFRENGKFYIKFPNNKPAFMGELVFLNDQNWVLKNNQIKIGSKKDNYNLMHILVKRTNGKTYFFIVGMRLEMIKE